MKFNQYLYMFPFLTSCIYESIYITSCINLHADYILPNIEQTPGWSQFIGVVERKCDILVYLVCMENSRRVAASVSEFKGVVSHWSVPLNAHLLQTSHRQSIKVSLGRILRRRIKSGSHKTTLQDICAMDFYHNQNTYIISVHLFKFSPSAHMTNSCTFVRLFSTRRTVTNIIIV